MKRHLLTLCLCVAVSVVSSRTLATVQERQTFKVNIVEAGTEFTEQVDVDVENNVERIYVPAHNDVSGGYYIIDFNKNLTLRREESEDQCFLKNMSLLIERDMAVKPRELADALQQAAAGRPRSDVTVLNHWYIGEEVTNRSILSEEMRELCDGIPIYWLQILDDSVSVTTEEGGERPRMRRLAVGKVDQPIYSIHTPETTSCTQENQMSRCKLSRRSCMYVYLRNCNEIRLEELSESVIHCASDNVRHMVDEILCCRPCCQSQNQADTLFPYCETYNNVTCPVGSRHTGR